MWSLSLSRGRSSWVRDDVANARRHAPDRKFGGLSREQARPREQGRGGRAAGEREGSRGWTRADFCSAPIDSRVVLFASLAFATYLCLSCLCHLPLLALGARSLQ